MAARAGEGGAPRGSRSGAGTFELERFAWQSPDRLELSGRFAGLAGLPDDDPVLVVRGPGGRHRLPAAPSARWPPPAGETWEAAFVWQHPPAPFEAVELQLGEELAVDLPRPGSHRRRTARRALPVRRAGDEADDEAAAVGGTGESATPPTPAGDLAAAQQEAHEAEAAVGEAHAELLRAREELEAERRRRVADAERMREALDSVRAVAEEIVAADPGELAQLGAQLEAADAKLEATPLQQLQQQLDATVAARRAQAHDVSRLRERNAALEVVATSVDEMRRERDLARREADELRTELERTQGALEEARRECDALRARLDAIRLAVDEGR